MVFLFTLRSVLTPGTTRLEGRLAFFVKDELTKISLGGAAWKERVKTATVVAPGDHSNHQMLSKNIIDAVPVIHFNTTKV